MSEFGFKRATKYSRADVYQKVTGKKDKLPFNFHRTGYGRIDENLFAFINIGFEGHAGKIFENKFDKTAERLIWYGKKKSHSNQPLMKELIDGSLSLQCFARWEDNDDFTYLGVGKILDYRDGAVVIDADGNETTCIEFTISTRKRDKTWKEDIIQAIESLGGIAHRSDILKEVKKIRKGNLNSTWDKTVQKELESHSSDSEVFNKKEDIFYSVMGKGKGVWGLRDTQKNPISQITDIEDDNFNSTGKEGKVKLVKHLYRERDKDLVVSKKKSFQKKHGKLFCEACNFDFKNKYGERGEGFIECHHIVPLSEIEKEQETKLSDLALLCSNCHRMVHRKKKWLTMSQLKKIIVTK